MNGVVGRQLPDDPALRLVEDHRGQFHPFLAQPQMNLPNATELGKLAEHERDRFAHTLIRIHPDSVPVHPHDLCTHPLDGGMSRLCENAVMVSFVAVVPIAPLLTCSSRSRA